MKYIVYFDSGTSNSRGYLLDDKLALKCTCQRQIGSKDSAIAGSNLVLIDGLYAMYRELLDSFGLADQDVAAIYASGMVTSPYGLIEVPHLKVPLSTKEIADSLFAFEEHTRFMRTVFLVPGLKTVHEDISFVNNMRGEEIEIVGLMAEKLRHYGDEPLALVMPGSHTHITRIRGNAIEGIMSTFTGELFFALKTDTILAPVLGAESSGFDPSYIQKGVQNLKKFGFSRAVYICHTMRLFNEASAQQRLSYAEGVIMGGVCQALEHNCRTIWQDIKTAVVVSNPAMGNVYETILRECEPIKRVDVIPISSSYIPALEGIRALLSVKRSERVVI